MGKQRATRGQGLLENFLSRKRAQKANVLLRVVQPRGRILDIGCGSYPLFLASTSFAEKFGLDQVDPRHVALKGNKLQLSRYDFEKDRKLPFSDKYFDAVTMLAVFEHIEPKNLHNLLWEVRRVLRPGGAFVLTTPARWTAVVLRCLARLGMVSAEEINEHKGAYTKKDILSWLEKAGFDRNKIGVGVFEGGINIWSKAEK